MMNGTIYKITCLANGKAYIGQTLQNLENRWNHHKSGKGSKGVYNAIKKYGVEMFKIERLHSNIRCRDVLNQLEIALIAVHDTYKNGYNEHPGGQDEYRYAKAWEHAEDIIRLYTEGKKSLREIAEQQKTSTVTILAILEMNGIQRRHWSDAWEHSEEICNLYTQEKKSASVIARLYGVHENTILNILEHNKVKRRKTGRRKSELWDHADEICRLYLEEGLSLEKIAARFDTNAMAIRRVLIGCNIELRKYSPRKSEKPYQLLLDL